MKRAFTLIELLVYMAIMGFIIVVAGRAFSDSTSMRVRTQNMTKAAEEVNKTAAILKEDISQMGAKSWKVANTDSFKVAGKVYNSTTDSSSYELDVSDANYHKFIFRKVHYGGNKDTCFAVLKITWEVIDSTLYRKCEPLPDPKCPIPANYADECPELPLAMTTGVKSFTLLPNKPASSNNFPFGNTGFGLIDRGNSDVYFETQIDNNKISGFKKVSSDKKLHQVLVTAGDAISSYTDCKKFPFKKDAVYAIQFKTPINLKQPGNIPDSMALFKPGIDHIAVGLRDGNANYKGKIGTDFLFWPPQTADSDNQKHYMEFSIPANLSLLDKICVVFEFSFGESSLAYRGALKIEDFLITEKNDKAYTFEAGNYPVDKKDKEDVKAFELGLKIDRRGEIGKVERYVIPTPNNGIKAKSTES